MNPGAHEGQAVPASYTTPFMLETILIDYYLTLWINTLAIFMTGTWLQTLNHVSRYHWYEPTDKCLELPELATSPDKLCDNFSFTLNFSL